MIRNLLLIGRAFALFIIQVALICGIWVAFMVIVGFIGFEILVAGTIYIAIHYGVGFGLMWLATWLAVGCGAIVVGLNSWRRKHA